MRDEELVSQFIDGKEEAFEELMLRYQKPVFYFVKSIVFDTEEAGDITQKAFIRAFNSLGGLKKRKQFRSWLYSIALNLTRDSMKGRRDEVDLDGIDIPDGNAQFENTLIQRELVGKVRAAMKVLPPRQREVLSLRVFQGMGFNEISEMLGMKPETARANFHFAIKGLREHLRKEAADNEM